VVSAVFGCQREALMWATSLLATWGKIENIENKRQQPEAKKKKNTTD